MNEETDLNLTEVGEYAKSLGYSYQEYNNLVNEIYNNLDDPDLPPTWLLIRSKHNSYGDHSIWLPLAAIRQADDNDYIYGD